MHSRAPGRGWQELLRDCRAAVADLRTRCRPLRAWEQLQERDASGNARGPLPYTNEALEELRAALEEDPEDFGILHHLAIATHARAWDLELAGSPASAAAWQEALAYWRQLAARGPFWAALKDQLRACDARADMAVVDGLRARLMEDLLQVHVDFICLHCEAGASERARTHVQIVQRAQIAPALQAAFKDRVFDAMTAPVAEAKAKGEYVSALTTVERYLQLFPDHIPALRMHAEVCQEWVRPLSFKDDWDQILTRAQRAEPPATRLAKHPDLTNHPLARTALEGLSGELMSKGHQRGWAALLAYQHTPSRKSLDEAREAHDWAIDWGCRGCGPGSPHTAIQVDTLIGRAYAYRLEIEATIQSDLDASLIPVTIEDKARRGLGLIEEAEGLDQAVVERAASLKGQFHMLLGLQQSLDDLLSFSEGDGE